VQRRAKDCYNGHAFVSLGFEFYPAVLILQGKPWQLERIILHARTDIREVGDRSRKIRCLLAHDYVLLRQGLRRILEDEADLEVAGEAGNAAECLRKTRELSPDVVIAGANIFSLPASEVQMCVARESPLAQLVLLSSQDETGSPFRGLWGPPAGWAVRETSAEELIRMIRNAGGPAARVPADVHDAFARRDPQRALPTVFPQERTLTAREREVLKLLAEGKTVRSVAAALGVSNKTVDAHKFNLMRKLGIHNKAELVMWAIQKRVVKIPANF
jgi:DNA-binding NarL/FixJ family response regulator